MEVVDKWKPFQDSLLVGVGTALVCDVPPLAESLRPTVRGSEPLCLIVHPSCPAYLQHPFLQPFVSDLELEVLPPKAE